MIIQTNHQYLCLFWCQRVVFLTNLVILTQRHYPCKKTTKNSVEIGQWKGQHDNSLSVHTVTDVSNLLIYL